MRPLGEDTADISTGSVRFHEHLCLSTLNNQLKHQRSFPRTFPVLSERCQKGSPNMHAGRPHEERYRS